ncbi:hypothetical protein QBK99_20140 [Corticibacterium sp. UT-5YL-CI-8]|nr:hypothetical protein [Tianweitania sp. UT-5YL-CI-8]
MAGGVRSANATKVGTKRPSPLSLVTTIIVFSNKLRSSRKSVDANHCEDVGALDDQVAKQDPDLKIDACF